jgi:hypothetical protein
MGHIIIQENHDPLHDKTLGHRSQDGLIGSYRAFVFLDENIPIDRHFVIFEVGHRYWTRCTAVFTKEDWSTRNAEWERVRPRYPSRCAIIINDLSDAQQEIFGIFRHHHTRRQRRDLHQIWLSGHYITNT